MGSTMRVIIVDDQPAFRRQLRQLLIFAGLEVIGEAGDIFHAIELVQAFHPDLAIVDIMLPGINGLDGSRRLKSISPSLRLVLTSAYPDQADVFAASAHAVGAEAFFPKDELDLETVQAWKEAL